MTPSARRLFVAGATGAVGRTLLRVAGEIPLVAHVRPRTAARGGVDPRAAVFELGDAQALQRAMGGCTTVLQLIGTTRRRFASGDTYETSDVGTTLALLEAASACGVDHFILLSSVGAGRPIGAYLRAKARAEDSVRQSGLPYTLVRPSAFVGEGHHVPAAIERTTRWLGLERLRPIGVETLARTLLSVALRRDPLAQVLEGRSLWAEVARAERGAS